MSGARALATGSRGAVDGLVRLCHSGTAVWQRAREALALRATAAGARVRDGTSRLMRPAPLRHGLAAVERGNLDAAFALLREAAELRPSDLKTSLAFWEVALACDRAGDAVDVMVGVVQREAASERKSDAVTHWMALMTEAPTAVVDPASLARLFPELKTRVVTADGPEERDRACTWLVSALRQCVDPRGGELTTGLALRVFEEARPFDPELARRAARIVLDSPDLHAAKRSRVESLLASLDDPAPAPPGPSPAEAPDEDASEPAAPPPRVVIDVAPVELEERALLLLEIDREQRTRVDFRAVEAVSVARVEDGGASVLLIDLVLQRSRRHTTRRILRMRADRFDPQSLFPDMSDAGESLRALLAELLERTHAVPLPDPDSALGLDPRRYQSIGAYETAVLDRLQG